LLEALASVVAAGPQLDAVEFFSGCQSITLGLREQGLNTQPYDLNLGPNCDMTTPLGYAHALRLVAQVRPGGFIWAAPPCSSWVWMNRGTSLRSKKTPLGACSKDSVASSNLVVTRMTLLLLLALGKGCHWCLEQPGGSLMEHHPVFAAFLTSMKHFRIRTWMGMFGAESPKATILWCQGLSSATLRYAPWWLFFQ
jgi:hypothetical protein